MFKNDCILQSHSGNFENSANECKNRKKCKVGDCL